MKNRIRKPFVWLIVDDDEDERLLIRKAVKASSQQRKFEVDLLFLNDGLELLEYLSSSSNGNSANLRPDLISLDLKKPRSDGGEVLKEIKSNKDFRDIPVVVFTATERTSVIEEGYRSGANTVIQKPADFARLTSVLQLIVNYWGCLARSPKGFGCAGIS